jgi:monoamine oxidase
MTMRDAALTDGELDVAIVGAGAAGTYLGYRLIQARPDWRIAIFERSNRVGGRLWSVKVDGLAHPIELGGMRYMSGHPLVQSVVDELGIETRAFDPADQPERTFLRGIVGRGPDDPGGGRGYDLPAGEAGRSASDLMRSAFLEIVPQARELNEAGWRRHRGKATFGGRPLTDWSIDEAVATVLSPEGHRFVIDAFGYDSGIRPHNAGDAVQYVMGTGYPSGQARVPVDGMDRITRELATRFEALGGKVRLEHEVQRVEAGEGSVLLGFADGSGVRARRLALTLPIPALEFLADVSPVINGPTWRRLYRSIAGYPATKVYCWYDRPWWRDGVDAPTGLRTTTDLPNRKAFYFDEAPDRPAAILAAYTDYRDNEPIVSLADGRSGGAPATAALLEAVRSWLAAAHPGAKVPAQPTGSAFQHWGADPREVAWHYWR